MGPHLFRVYLLENKADVRRRVRVAWQGILASRQTTNLYVFQSPATEFAGRTILREIERKEAHEATEVRQAQEGLARARAVIEARIQRVVAPGIPSYNR